MKELVIIGPEDFQQQVRSEVAALLCLLPHWCIRLTVMPYDDSDGALAAATTEEKYRRGTIEIDAEQWPDLSSDERRAALLHEFAHLYTGPLLHAARDGVLSRIDNPVEREAMAWFLQEAVERSTSDVANALLLACASNDHPAVSTALVSVREGIFPLAEPRASDYRTP